MTLCVDTLELCLARHPLQLQGCRFTLLPGNLSDQYPLVPQPCVVVPEADGSGERPFTGAHQFSGTNMPVSYCLAARETSGLPPQKCVYPDGTEVVAGPPDDPCPGPDASMLVCGGTCGEVICPWTSSAVPEPKTPCVGFSDTRAFGICAFTSRRCAASNVEAMVEECESASHSWFVGHCACMVLEPHPQLPQVGPTGFVVPAEACTRYRSFYPEGVECRDESWSLL